MRYQSARQMIFDAYSVSGDSTLAGAIERAKLGRDIQTSGMRSQDHRICHGIEAGRVISRVEALPMHQAALLRIAFGPFTREELATDRQRVAIILIREAMASGLVSPAKGQVGASHQLGGLCLAALHHHAETTWPYRRQGLPTPQAVRAWILQEQGVTLAGRWRWQGRPAWHNLWEHCLRTLDDWEAAGLAPVAELLHEDREARRAPALAEA